MIEIILLYVACTRIEKVLAAKRRRPLAMKVAAVLLYLVGAVIGAFSVETVRILRVPYSTTAFSSGLWFYTGSVFGGILGLCLALALASTLSGNLPNKSPETNALPGR